MMNQLVSALFLCLLVATANSAIAPKCMDGRSLSAPQPQPGLVNCPQYRDLACCSLETDALILPNANGTQLYGFNWNRCGPISLACQRFFQAESCYFECDPYQHPYGDPTEKPSEEFVGVPVCAGYCNAWFEACKNDMTCGVEWLYDFVPIDNNEGDTVSYGCAAETQCKTFAEVYQNPQGLCDLLWSSPFHYSEDEENCIVWDFALTTSNPNQYVQKVNYSESFCNTTYMLSLPAPITGSPQPPSCLFDRDLSTPSAQPDLKNCARYSGLSCCTPDTDGLITSDDPAAPILGYDWNACGPVSPACAAFFIQQACYFECDPYQGWWANPVLKDPSTFVGVPICSSFCDSWFEACKDDLTCGVEWIVSMVPVENKDNTTIGYTCASGTQCVSIASAYENGRGLCDMMFGSFYHYTEDTANCVSWDFSGSNPNAHVQRLPYAEGYCEPQVDQKLVAIVVISVVLGITILVLAGFIGFLIMREKKQRPVFSDVSMKKLDE